VAPELPEHLVGREVLTHRDELGWPSEELIEHRRIGVVIVDGGEDVDQDRLERRKVRDGVLRGPDTHDVVRRLPSFPSTVFTTVWCPLRMTSIMFL